MYIYFDVKWYSEDEELPLKDVRIQIFTHSKIVDAIQATVDQINEKLGQNSTFLLENNPNLYTMHVPDGDGGPEDPGNLLVY